MQTVFAKDVLSVLRPMRTMRSLRSLPSFPFLPFLPFPHSLRNLHLCPRHRRGERGRLLGENRQRTIQPFDRYPLSASLLTFPLVLVSPQHSSVRDPKSCWSFHDM